MPVPALRLSLACVNEGALVPETLGMIRSIECVRSYCAARPLTYYSAPDTP